MNGGKTRDCLIYILYYSKDKKLKIYFNEIKLMNKIKFFYYLTY